VETLIKAIRFHEYGDPGVLRYEDADRPEPAEALTEPVEAVLTTWWPPPSPTWSR
jgi:hypothetical protein